MKETSGKSGTAKIKYYLFLHIILFQLTLGGIVSKIAAGKEMFSLTWFLLYAVVLFNLFLYAIAWQQIIKKFALTTAFLNRPVTMIWGLLWGVLFFHETVKWNMFVGIIILVAGISLVVSEGE